MSTLVVENHGKVVIVNVEVSVRYVVAVSLMPLLTRLRAGGYLSFHSHALESIVDPPEG